MIASWCCAGARVFGERIALVCEGDYTSQTGFEQDRMGAVDGGMGHS